MAVVTTTKGFLITTALLFAGFIWTTFYQSAPYTTLATTLGIVFGALAGKRLIQKREAFKNE